MTNLIKEELGQLLFPETCLGCGKVGQWFCLDCQSNSRIDRSLRVCQICFRFTNKTGSLCSSHRKLTKLTALNSYGSLESKFLKRSIHKIKYEGCFAAVPFFTDLLIDRVESIFFNNKFSLIIPIPTSVWRYKSRGYNQAELIGRRIEQLTNIEKSGFLVKTKETLPQVGLSKTERQTNINGSLKWLGPKIMGKVLLVDDVLTTGSTLREAALVLRAAGAREIWAITLAYEPLLK